MPQFYTYLHCKPDGIPFYVGKGFGNRALKFTVRSQHHKNIVAKYGKENIDIFIFPRKSEAHALETEIRWIAQLRSDGCKLSNQTDGGEGSTGYKASDETRRKLSVMGLGKKMPPRSDEQKKTASLSRIGKKITPEQREKHLFAISLRKRPDGTERLCAKCGTLFDKNYCQQCRKISNDAYRVKNAASLKIKSKNRYEQNKDVLLEKKAIYYAANKEKIIAQSKKWHQENPEKARAKARKYAAKKRTLTTTSLGDK